MHCDHVPLSHLFVLFLNVQRLDAVGVSCCAHELAGDDHFSLIEQMESEDCYLNKVSAAMR